MEICNEQMRIPKFCTNCGSRIGVTDHFCAECGSPILRETETGDKEGGDWSCVPKKLNKIGPKTDLLCSDESNATRPVGWVAFLLCLTLGFAGVHRLYVRRIWTASCIFLLSLVSFGVVGFLWACVDLIQILSGRFKDADGNVLVIGDGEIENGGRRNTLARIFGMFGALVVALGVVILIEANWDSLSRPIRTIIAMAPITLCIVASITCTHCSVKYRPLWEQIGIVTFASMHLAVSVVDKTYGFDLSTEQYVFLTCVLTFLMASCIPSSVVRMVLGIYPLAWFSYLLTKGCYGKTIVDDTTISWVLMALSYVIYRQFLQQKPGDRWVQIGEVITALVFSCGAIVVYPLFAEILNAEMTDSRWLAVFWMTSLSVIVTGKMRSSVIWLRTPLIVVCLVSLPYMWCEHELFYWLSLLIAVFLVAWGSCKNDAFYITMGWMMALTLTVGKYANYSDCGYYISALGTSAVVVVIGVFRMSIVTVNIGMLVVLGLIIDKILGSSLSVGMKGVGVIVLGFILIVLNILIKNFLKRSLLTK